MVLLVGAGSAIGVCLGVFEISLKPILTEIKLFIELIAALEECVDFAAQEGGYSIFNPCGKFPNWWGVRSTTFLCSLE